MKSKKKPVRKKGVAVRVQRSVRRPACVLFSVREANETDVAVMKKLADAGCEIVVVQEEYFDAAMKAIESVRRRTLNMNSATQTPRHASATLQRGMYE